MSCPMQTVDLTLDTLDAEIAAINRFGRHRIPQFAYRSRLQVQPGTQIERDLDHAGLLTTGWLHRDFTHIDGKAAELSQDLHRYAACNIAPNLAGLDDSTTGAFEGIAILKLNEWDWLEGQVKQRLQSAPVD